MQILMVQVTNKLRTLCKGVSMRYDKKVFVVFYLKFLRARMQFKRVKVTTTSIKRN
jgi:hypothetical protein